MKVVIAGSHGLIGSALRTSLKAQGHEVFRLVRSERRGDDEIRWQPAAGAIDSAGLEGMDAVVNLGGESIMGLWTAGKRKRIRDSRVHGTALLADALAGLDAKPRVLVSASAVGFYGDRGDTVLDESSTPGEGFLAQVAQAWERATEPATDGGIRVAIARISMVLTPHGGALKAMRPAFSLGLGGRLGSGDQYWSWIALTDMVSVLEHLINDDNAKGPFNAASPHPVTNAAFTRALGQALHRPTPLPTPAFALKAVAGDMARQVLLASTRAVPARLEEQGYNFRLPQLDEALVSMLSPAPGQARAAHA